MDRSEIPAVNSVRAHLVPGAKEWLLSPGGPLGLCLAVALGQATLPIGPGGGVVAIAYYAALAGSDVRFLLLVAVAMVSSVFFVGSAAEPAYALVAALAMVELSSVWLRRTGLRRPTRVGLQAAGGVVVAESVRAVLMYADMEPLRLAFMVAMAVVLAMVLAPIPRAVRRGWPFALEEQVALAVVGLAAFGGALAFPAVGTWLAAGVAGFLILQAAARAGPSGGAVAGAVMGYGCFWFGSLGTAWQAMALAFVLSGVMAGLFRVLGRWMVALAYALSNALLLGLMLSFGEFFWTPFLAGGVGALAGCLLVTDIQLIAAVAPLSHQPGELDIRARARQQITGLARLFSNLQRSFDEVAVHAPVDAGAADLTQSLSIVHDKICSGCSLQQMCWEQDVFRTYQGLQRMWESLEARDEGQLHTATQDFGRRCVAVDVVKPMLAGQHERRRLERSWSLRLAEGRYVMAEYMQQMGQLLGRLANDLEPGRQSPPGEQRLAVQVHVASASKGAVSGDGILNIPLPDGRHLVMLSDGMGSGPPAAEQSRHAIRLVHQMLAAGFSSEVAVQTVNAILLLRSPSDTFATIDLAMIDLVGGRTEIMKVGAPPTLLKRGREIFHITGATAPVGIVGGIRPESHVRYLRPGDCLIMCTDGLWDQIGSSVRKDWLEEALRRAHHASPQILAERLLEEVTPKGEAADDVTVVVIGVAGHTKKSGDWQPVRRVKGVDPDA